MRCKQFIAVYEGRDHSVKSTLLNGSEQKKLISAEKFTYLQKKF